MADDAVAVEQFHGSAQGAHPVLGRIGRNGAVGPVGIKPQLSFFVQDPGRVAVGVAFDTASRRVGSRRVDPGPLQGKRVGGHNVAANASQHHGVVCGDAIEFRACRKAQFSQSARLKPIALDPLSRGLHRDPGSDLLRDVGDAVGSTPSKSMYRDRKADARLKCV